MRKRIRQELEAEQKESEEEERRKVAKEQEQENVLALRSEITSLSQIVRAGEKALLEAQMAAEKTIQDMAEQARQTNHTHNLMMIDLQTRLMKATQNTNMK